MFDRVYIEIGNVCNMYCSFCPGTKRAKRRMTPVEFETVCERISGYTDYLYFHVMGEPLLHPKLGELLEIAKNHKKKVCITTNGTLINKTKDVLLAHAEVLHRVSISLHAPEGNCIDIILGEYLDTVIAFAKDFSTLGVNVIYRLWNLDSEDRAGNNSQNSIIMDRLKAEYPEEWSERYSGYRLAYRTFLEFDGIFTWPSESCADETDVGRCHALSRQIAILADGTVVPCCLDSEGLMPLGNIFTQPLDKILNSAPAKDMQIGFRNGKMIHPVCKKCTYARRFS